MGSSPVDLVVSAITSGMPQLAVLAASALSILSWITRRPYNRRRQIPESDNDLTCAAVDRRRIESAPTLPYEVAAQIFRAASVFIFSLSAERSSATLVAYTFVVGLLRLTGSPPWQIFLRRQRNVVTGFALATLSAGYLLPCIQIGTTCSPTSSLPLLGTLALAISILVGLFTPQARNTTSAAPEDRASWWDRHISYSWVNGLMWRGLRGTVHTVNDLPPLPEQDNPNPVFECLQKAKEKGGEGCSIMWTLWYFSWKHTTGCAVSLAVTYMLDALSPVGLYGLLSDLANPEGATVKPWLWLMIMFVSSMGRSLAMNASIFFSQRNGIRIKSGFTMELHNRAMGCMELDEDHDGGDNDERTVAAEKMITTESGRISNMMSADLDTLWRLRPMLELFVGLLPGTILLLAWLIYVLGWAAVAGAVIVVLVVPLSATFASRIKQGRNAARSAQDGRISVISEFLSCIRAVKYFAWEDVVVERASADRAVEQKATWRVLGLKRIMSAMGSIIPYAAIVAIFAVDGFVQGNALTSAKAYTTISLIKKLRDYYSKVPNLTMQYMGIRVALERLDKYFSSTQARETVPAGPLMIQKARFLLGPARSGFVLKDISIRFVEGGLNVVSGISGSGKTGLLLSILGEARRLQGTLVRPLDVAFASQTPWVQHASVQDGIRFYAPFNKERYAAVLDACCLGYDLAAMPAGDQTVVGEGGSGLSGGQKARVALARALYSSAPLLLLDDVFSALDTRTAAAVWERCFCSDLLRGRTVVLVSQVPWMPSQADLSIVMDNGRAVAVEQNIGVVRRPMSSSEALQLDHHEVMPDDDDDDDDDDKNNNNKDDDDNEFSAGGGGGGGDETDVDDNGAPTPPNGHDVLDLSAKAVVQEEVDASGRASRYIVFNYLSYIGPAWYIALTSGLLVLSQVIWFSQTVWIAHWVDQPTSDKLSHMAFYLLVYALFILGEPVSRYFFRYALDAGCWHAARKLHLKLLRSVTAAPLSWHAFVPAGRVINRFSRDMSSLDWDLRPIIEELVGKCISFTFRIAAITSVMPVFIVPCLALSAVAGLVSETYSRTVIMLRRIDSSTQSPVFSIFGDCMAGRQVIRGHAHGSGATAKVLSEALCLHSAARSTTFVANRWLSVRVALLVSVMLLSASAMAITGSEIVSAGLIGLALTNASSIGSTIADLFFQLTMLEVELQKFDRIHEYATLVPEERKPQEGQEQDGEEHAAGGHGSDQTPASWPESGAVEFKNVSVRYTPDGPEILSNINLRFNAGERVAIVGRTGSGKSTLALTLLRFTHVSSGQVLLSSRPITSVRRQRLRESIALIPQEPVLLAGTVSFNLNPTGTVPPSALASAVASCGDVGTAMGEWAAPDARVGPGGGNLSHGQRQVLALCRALARRNKLVVLDEATANMDYITDAGIQRVLRREMERDGESRTLITIAHRLRTIVDYDKVVVMGKGKVIEIGSPKELYNMKGAFYSMVRHSGEASILEKLFQDASTTSNEI